MAKIQRTLVSVALGILIVVAIFGGAAADRLFGVRPLDLLIPRSQDGGALVPNSTKQIISEESVVTQVVEKSLPAVVTISVETPKRQVLQFSPFGGFDVDEQGGEQQDIATGFIVSKDGLIVTNKHVVSTAGITYKAVTQNGQEYEVKKIYRDPANDLSILKIDPSDLPVLELGDSDNLKLGQLAIAIGTPLGEFRQSVTTGVISGLGREIEAGSGNPFEGFVERLDNVIQTDAAINPGNSGGPLLDSSGKVIGVNVAVAAGAQNIGFAIPINVLKGSIKQFNETGQFSRPFLGVQYTIVSKQAALVNEIPEGAFVRDVVEGSSADLAGIKVGDIITEFAGEKVDEKSGGLAVMLNKHKVGETIETKVYRDETKKIETVKIVLQEAK